MGSHAHTGAMVRRHAQGGLHAVRQGGESVVTGTGLGFIHAHHGLDVTVKKADAAGKGAIKVPVDAVIAGLGIVGSMVLSDDAEGLGRDSLNVAGAALGVFSFRKTMDLLAEKKAAQGQTTAGTVGATPAGTPAAGSAVHGEDPILKAARSLP